MIYKTIEEVAAALTFWQEMLRLQDWRIDVEIVRRKDMYLENTQGCNRWFIDGLRSRIQLLHPLDYETDYDTPQDHETTLVHELLHLHYAYFDHTESGSLGAVHVEQSINFISEALVTLKRKAFEEDDRLQSAVANFKGMKKLPVGPERGVDYD